MRPRSDRATVAMHVVRGDAEQQRLALLARGWRKHIEVFERVRRWEEGRPVLEIMDE